LGFVHISVDDLVEAEGVLLRQTGLALPDGLAKTESGARGTMVRMRPRSKCRAWPGAGAWPVVETWPLVGAWPVIETWPLVGARLWPKRRAWPRAKWRV
jgi:hypothetical protein